MHTAQKTPFPLLLCLQHHCEETEVIRLLPAYWSSRECVYQVVAQQQVYVSQYLQIIDTGTYPELD
jgi:hypothetical protein